MSASIVSLTDHLPRRCRKCDKEKPLSDFPVNKRNKDGHEIRCRPCLYVWRREKNILNKKMAWREVRKGRNAPVPTAFVCKKCKIEKPSTQFHRQPSYPNGINTQCRKCVNEYNFRLYDKNPLLKKRKLEKNKFPSKLNKLKRKYGLSWDAYRALYTSQAGKCLICQKPMVCGGRGCHVDHCHMTNKVRGLLCGGCNTGLGLFRDNPEFLSSAAKYIRDRSGP